MKKNCTTCGSTKKLEEFNRDSNTPSGRRSQCKVCTRKKNKEFRVKNRQSEIERQKKWREENVEHRKEYNRKNRDLILANTRKRQVRKKVQTPDLCQMERDMIKALYFISKVLSNSCSYNFNVDHIMPISKGGLHTFSNLQILAEHENKSKGNKTWQ